MEGFTPYSFEGDLPTGFDICGETGQLLHIDLQPGQEVLVEPGAMIYTSNDVKSTVRARGLISSIKSSMGGESLFKIHWKNNGSEVGYIGVSPDFPATIIPINMQQYPGGILCKRDAFMAAISTDTTTTVDVMKSNSCLACCCSGIDFLAQKVIGGNSMAFLAAHGTILTKELAEGEVLVVDTQAIVAFAPSVTIDVQMTGGCLSVCCLGEGLFNTTLTGPGTVFLTSMPLEKIQGLLGPLVMAHMKAQGSG
jgi:uncharacterized protein (AIM24 family)